MKKTVIISVLIVIIVGFSGALYYLYQKNEEDPITYSTEYAVTDDIIRKTVATGRIIPQQEIYIKPNISGVIDEVLVKEGDQVQSGDLIARIRIIPNAASLQAAKNNIESSKIDLAAKRKTYLRQKSMFERGVISESAFEGVEASYKLSKQQFKSASENYDILKTGSAKNSNSVVNTEVRSTVDGMVLNVLVKVGNKVIESNNFNDGTTIAVVSDVTKMIFEGKVDESEVGKVKEGMPLEITIGAIENVVFDAELDFISPKGIPENGAIQFKIQGSVEMKDSIFVRAGLSANAAIILERVDQVLAIREALVQYDGGTNKFFVEVETADGVFERRDVELGISNGILVEVRSGVDGDDKIKVWNAIQNVF